MEIFLGFRKIKLDDQDIHVYMKPLNIADYQEMLKYISNNEKNKDIKEIGIDILANKKIIELIDNILPKYCGDIEGIEIVEDEKIGRKRAARIEDIVSSGIFFNIAFSILIKLFSISSLNSEEEKSIKKQ